MTDPELFMREKYYLQYIVHHIFSSMIYITFTTNKKNKMLNTDVNLPKKCIIIQKCFQRAGGGGYTN